MTTRTMTAVVLIPFWLVGATFADTESFAKFERDYKALQQEIMVNDGEIARIKDFVYQKDVATFTFIEGSVLLQKPIDGRPTVAIFVGEGYLYIDIPSPVERQALIGLGVDSIVDEPFQVCYIRFADDLDLKLRENFKFKKGGLKAAQFRAVKDAQPEAFFKPTLYHSVDNYFQLLRSAYERAEDGYFWANVDRWVFNFDPNRAEEVRVSYELEHTQAAASSMAVMQRAERQIYDNLDMSRLTYPTQAVKKTGTFFMGGADGCKMDAGHSTIDLLINRDSLRYLQVNLHHNLSIDSVKLGANNLDYNRRKDFDLIGLILPQYFRKNDTMTLDFYIHGANYGSDFAWVEGISQCLYSFDLIIPRNYNYYISGQSAPVDYDEDHQKISIEMTRSQAGAAYYCNPSGADTSSQTTSHGIEIKYVDDVSTPRFRLKEKHREAVSRAFDFFCDLFGNPLNIEEMYLFHGIIFRYGGQGWMMLTDDNTFEEQGGFYRHVGRAVGEQWFSSAVQCATNRDYWMRIAIPEYLSMMFIQNELGDKVYYTNLVSRKTMLFDRAEDNREIPLAKSRGSIDAGAHKGVWMLHMLRSMMYDVQNQSDERFLEFLRELIFMGHNRRFNTADFVQVAERHVGSKLDWFFDQWLFGVDLPVYRAQFSIEREEDGYYFDFDVKTTGTREDFVMPVMIRLDFDRGSAFVRKPIGGKHYTFRLGPYPYPPTGAFFNEHFSVLSDFRLEQE
ncbi:MAG: hypothetical protein JSU65_01675 [Candidatus Zixiibacteriota bacterium]|nr:MAG: hypothetical protein JSU65_01675 [candidate division Zixibacteria bacterium]